MRHDLPNPYVEPRDGDIRECPECFGKTSAHTGPCSRCTDFLRWAGDHSFAPDRWDLSLVRRCEGWATKHRKPTPLKSFFDPETMRYFDCRVETDVLDNTVAPAWAPRAVFFVTSEQYHHPDGESEPRLYTLRVFDPDSGWVHNFLGFQTFRNLADARIAARTHEVPDYD